MHDICVIIQKFGVSKFFFFLKKLYTFCSENNALNYSKVKDIYNVTEDLFQINTVF